MQNKSSRLEYHGVKFHLLTLTGKMPWYSYSLTAWDSCPGAKVGEALIADGSVLGPGKSVCGSCYARKGNYRFPSVMAIQAARTAWTRDSIASGRFTQRMINDLAYLSGGKPQYFRIHDAGDFFSPAYVDAWFDVCASLPHIKFWAPTRSYLVAPIRTRLERLSILLDNVTIRPSALRMDEPAPKVVGFSSGSGVVKATQAHEHDSYLCPAPKQGNACGDCRRCWDLPLAPVHYHAH